MAWFSKSNRSAIGIDVGSKYLRAVQLLRADGVWRIEAATAIPRPASQGPLDREEAEQFAAVLDRQGFTGHDAVLAVPDDVLLGGILELPPRESGAPLDQIAKMEVSRLHRCEPDSFEMAAWDLPAAGPNNDATRVMVSACPHQDSDRILDVFESARLNVVALDTGAWSIARACSPLITTAPNSVIAILDLGWHLGRLAVLYDGVIIYERTIHEAGIKLLSETLVERTGLGVEMVDLMLLDALPDPPSDAAAADLGHGATLSTAVSAHADSMVEELKQSFSYAMHRYPGTVDQQLLLVGGGGGIPGMCRCLAQAIGLTVRPANIADLAPCADHLTQSCHGPAFVKALGLAMHGQDPSCDG